MRPSSAPHSTQLRDVREEPGQPEELQLERQHERVERGPAPGPAARACRARRGTGSARGTHGRSAPPRCRGAASPRARRARPGGGRDPCATASCEWTSDAPVTVPSSPRPRWRPSSTCENGSRRPPKRLFVRVTPLAIAPAPPARGGVQVQHAVGLAERERAEHHGLRDRGAGHARVYEPQGTWSRSVPAADSAGRARSRVRRRRSARSAGRSGRTARRDGRRRGTRAASRRAHRPVSRMS